MVGFFFLSLLQPLHARVYLADTNGDKVIKLGILSRLVEIFLRSRGLEKLLFKADRQRNRYVESQNNTSLLAQSIYDFLLLTAG